jgi:MraZ protein
MTHFLGTHTGKLDKKGRVSVPAPFRAALERLQCRDIILLPSHRMSCVDAMPQTAFERLAAGIDQLPAFSTEYDDLSTSLFADAHPAIPDAEGRIVLPQALIDHAQLGDAIAFMGLGRTFQLWEPEAARARAAEARSRARERGMTLPAPLASTPNGVA